MSRSESEEEAEPAAAPFNPFSMLDSEESEEEEEEEVEPAEAAPEVEVEGYECEHGCGYWSADFALCGAHEAACAHANKGAGGGDALEPAPEPVALEAAAEEGALAAEVDAVAAAKKKEKAAKKKARAKAAKARKKLEAEDAAAAAVEPAAGGGAAESAEAKREALKAKLKNKMYGGGDNAAGAAEYGKFADPFADIGSKSAAKAEKEKDRGEKAAGYRKQVRVSRSTLGLRHESSPSPACPVAAWLCLSALGGGRRGTSVRPSSSSPDARGTRASSNTPKRLARARVAATAGTAAPRKAGCSSPWERWPWASGGAGLRARSASTVGRRCSRLFASRLNRTAYMTSIVVN